MSSISENVDDRLSRLPEDILSHILSLMPTKYAVRTSVLSKRWRYSWMFVTDLDFDDIHPYHDEKTLSKIVDRVLKFCKTSKLRSVRLHLCDKVVSKSSVSSWIDKMVRLNVCELDVQLVLLELPFSLFTCKTLTKLRIDVSADKYGVWECRYPVNLPCLKTLDVVVYTNPFDNAFRLIRGCPMLESLSLEVIWCAHNGDYVFNIPTLKRLKLTNITCGYAVNYVVLRVPNLEYLYVGGMLGSWYVMEDLPSSVEASVSFDCLVSSDCTILDLWGQFLKGINGVKSLSVKKLLSSSPLPMFPNTKRLELKDLWDSGKVLESCPALEHLCIEKVVNYLWIKPKLVPACLLTNLTTIKFSTRKWQKCDMEFLEYMLRNAEVLKTVTITLENLCIEEERRLCLELIELPRASSRCEIRFTVMTVKDGRLQHR
ncbi:putative F-box domain, FBD domain, leucine-rich repeat domain superfamily [Helianthus annuus]|nr:putative F-box domain, FBD domain, leucine-rich repeat domain superfamily [Helianthus annuus]